MAASELIPEVSSTLVAAWVKPGLIHQIRISHPAAEPAGDCAGERSDRAMPRKLGEERAFKLLVRADFFTAQCSKTLAPG